LNTADKHLVNTIKKRVGACLRHNRSRGIGQTVPGLGKTVVGMNGANFLVRLSRQEGVQIIGGLALFDLSNGSPARPIPRSRFQRR